jgi:DNA polymerase III epsilon subunit family exonuclease
VRLDRKLTLSVLALVLPPAAAAGVVIVLLNRAEALPGAPTVLALGLTGLVATLLYVAVLAHRLGRAFLRPVQTLLRGVELMSTVNPEHRLAVRTGDELQALAEEINRLAERLRTVGLALDERVAAATQALDLERRRLAGVLGELAEGVLVATAEGRVALANRVAAGLLSDGQSLLGRPLEELLDRATTDRHLTALHDRGAGVERFRLTTARGVPLEGAMTILLDQDGGRSGIIVVLRDPAAADGAAALTDPRRLLAGAGLYSGVGSARPGPARPEIYDFSLFDEMEPAIATAERDRRLEQLVFVVFDTETTGLRPESGDRVISLAGVRVRGLQIRDGEAFDALVRPGRAIPAESVEFHGITDAMVAEAPGIDVVLPAFLRFAGDAVLVGHEVSFDLRFLEPEARRLGLPSLKGRPILDTRLLSGSLHGPGEPHTLEAIAARLGVPVTARHSALGDALATAHVLVRLLALLQKRGVYTLGEVLDAVRRARGPAV